MTSSDEGADCNQLNTARLQSMKEKLHERRNLEAELCYILAINPPKSETLDLKEISRSQYCFKMQSGWGGETQGHEMDRETYKNILIYSVGHYNMCCKAARSSSVTLSNLLKDTNAQSFQPCTSFPEKNKRPG